MHERPEALGYSHFPITLHGIMGGAKELVMSTKNTPLTLNATYTIEIRDLGVHGEGIGSAENFTVFVPGALPGETVKAKIILIKKSYASGKLISVEKPSPYRTLPQCPVYDSCGGCQISHLTYEGQLAAKERRVKDVMVRIGKASEDVVLPILGAPHEWNYRNKMAVPVGQVTGGPVLGYYRQGTHQIVPIQECLIQEEENNRLLRFAEDFMIRHGITGYNEKSGKGCVRHVMGRVGDNGEVMAVIVTATENLPKKDLWAEEIQKALPEVVSLYHDVQNKKRNVILGPEIHHIWGRKTLTASLCGIAFEVSPFSFFQVHKAQAEVLYQKALDAADLKGGETVIDAYCGTGTISLCLAKKARRVIGIEIVREAIEDAKKNAAFNHIENAEFHAADAGLLMPKLYEEGLRPDVIVMDPVRAGCSEDVLKAAAGMQPARIVYVSCNPATFARDAEILGRLGYYKLQSVQPVDMFPQTTHVETVCLLSKLNAKQHIEVDIHMDELDLTDAEKKATYSEIKEYVLEHTGLKVSSLYIAQVKQKCGIIERENYNKPKSDDAKQPQCPPDKEKAIKEALKHFGMI